MNIDLDKFQEWLDSLTEEDEEKLREEYIHFTIFFMDDDDEKI